MAGRELTHDEFQERRRKEHLAFLVVKFLMAYDEFERIHGDFKAMEERGSLAQGNLFERVRTLEETLAFDIKEKAHELFRSGNHARGERRRPPSRISKRALNELKHSIVIQSIDASIGTGYHHLAILRESLYQLQHYAPEYAREQAEVEELEQMARKLGYTFSSEDLHELGRLRQLTQVSVRLASETQAMSRRMMARTRALFRGTAELIRWFIEGAEDNEVLVQNLLLHRDLLERVYGPGSSERIFTELCKGKDVPGRTGLERALNYARRRCGNCEGLPATL